MHTFKKMKLLRTLTVAVLLCMALVLALPGEFYANAALSDEAKAAELESIIETDIRDYMLTLDTAKFTSNKLSLDNGENKYTIMRNVKADFKMYTTEASFEKGKEKPEEPCDEIVVVLPWTNDNGVFTTDDGSYFVRVYSYSVNIFYEDDLKTLKNTAVLLQDGKLEYDGTINKEFVEYVKSGDVISLWEQVLHDLAADAVVPQEPSAVAQPSETPTPSEAVKTETNAPPADNTASNTPAPKSVAIKGGQFVVLIILIVLTIACGVFVLVQIDKVYKHVSTTSKKVLEAIDRLEKKIDKEIEENEIHVISENLEEILNNQSKGGKSTQTKASNDSYYTDWYPEERSKSEFDYKAYYDDSAKQTPITPQYKDPLADLPFLLDELSAVTENNGAGWTERPAVGKLENKYTIGRDSTGVGYSVSNTEVSEKSYIVGFSLGNKQYAIPTLKSGELTSQPWLKEWFDIRGDIRTKLGFTIINPAEVEGSAGQVNGTVRCAKKGTIEAKKS